MARPGRPCRVPTCYRLAPCTLHPSGPFATARRTSNLYATPQWSRIRRTQLDAEPYCRMCRTEGQLVKATVADHIEPHNGDERAFWANALQSLCKRHSNAKTGRETRERARS